MLRQRYSLGFQNKAQLIKSNTIKQKSGVFSPLSNAPSRVFSNDKSCLSKATSADFLCRIVSDTFMMKRQRLTQTQPLALHATLQSPHSSYDNLMTPCFSVNYSTPVHKERKESTHYEQDFNTLYKKRRFVPVPDKNDKTFVDTELDCLCILF